jgi:simple sugar transport system ATP-binding protein/ribose transport system ATP-binding protein
MNSAPHIELRGVTKKFGGTLALDGVDLTIVRGTVHSIIGENGAGKSTLGKIVAGVHAPDSGELRVAGRPVHFRSPRQALDHGLTIVAQELDLVPARSVIENVFLGQEDHIGPFVRRGAVRRRFAELVERSGIEVPGNASVASLSVAQQQKVEVLRALARNAELIVMDEPSARLTAAEAEVLVGIVRRLAAGGTTVVFVSHFLDEVLAVSDRITIMRDGQVVRTLNAPDATRPGLITDMIGRPLDSSFPARNPVTQGARSVLQVRDLSRDGHFDNVSFDVKAGEIVVLAGLVGAGRSEVARTIYGAEKADRGTIELDGRVFRPRSPADAVQAGVAMIPESRKSQGLQHMRSIGDNVSLPHLAEFSRGGVVRAKAESQKVKQIISAVGVRPETPDTPVSALSGGNQQKVLFARSLLRTPSLLIADEPTRGVDVGAKRSIYDLVAGLAGDGMGVLIISSELEEVLGLAHRVIVMRGGQITAELVGEQLTERDVMQAAFGYVPDTATEEIS